MNKIPITIIVSAKNEVLNLLSSMEKRSRFLQLIVVDSSGTDDAIAIATAMGAEVVQFHGMVNFLKNEIGHYKMQILFTNGFCFLMLTNLLQKNLSMK